MSSCRATNAKCYGESEYDIVMTIIDKRSAAGMDVEAGQSQYVDFAVYTRTRVYIPSIDSGGCCSPGYYEVRGIPRNPPEEG